MDALCFEDLDEFGRELDDPIEELVQDVIHLLLEEYGSNPDDLTRGVGLVGALSGPSTRIAHIQANIESQLHDDDRITNASCIIRKQSTRGVYRVDLTLIVSNATIPVSLEVDSSGGIRRLG